MQGLFAVFQFGKKTIPDAAECGAFGLGQVKAFAPVLYCGRDVYGAVNVHTLNITFPNGKFETHSTEK